jgi:predicted transcriptional regulator
MAIVLEAANGGTTKSRILVKANLTSGQLRQYLDVLLDKKLIIELADDDKRHIAYRTTERGMRYLDMYSALKNIAVFQQGSSD